MPGDDRYGTYDLLDAYLAGPHVAWDQAKWESTWLKYESPGKAYRPRDEAKARLAQSRIPDTSPTRPLGEYAATYRSELYGDLVITHQDGQLRLEFAGFNTALTHWHVGLVDRVESPRVAGASV